MYDMSAKFNIFYTDYVVLPRDAQEELYSKKTINIHRLKEGLEEYNEENGTSYKVVESCVQGSVAMSTVVRNEDNDYDIDVAIVFEASNLGEMGALATRNMVAEALKRKTKQFNTEPEVKTSCVRVVYADGYHIDYAIYRRSWDGKNNKWLYEHAGAEWTNRELRGIEEWFKDHNDALDQKLRRVVRLSKMFCNSRENWKNMPSGLLQTVLCNENLQTTYSRIDELFYFTMKEIVNRLELDTKVIAPVDNGRKLTSRQIDLKKMINWKNRLRSKLEDLEVLFQNECSEDDAIHAWYGFFNHNYWLDKNYEISSFALRANQKSSFCLFDETEQFIDEMFPVDIRYTCRVLCQINGDGWTDTNINDYLGRFKRFIPHNFRVKCTVTYTDCPGFYSVYWKVKNVGSEAVRRNCLRGQIIERGKIITEPTNFFGHHYIECYIVQNNVCVAKTKIDIPIGRR